MMIPLTPRQEIDGHAWRAVLHIAGPSALGAFLQRRIRQLIAEAELETEWLASPERRQMEAGNALPAPVSVASEPLAQTTRPAFAAQRADLCLACDRHDTCPLWEHKLRRPCRFKSYLRRPNALCLGDQPPRWGPTLGDNKPPAASAADPAAARGPRPAAAAHTQAPEATE